LLFAGSDRGGQRAALLYSLIVTAKLNGVDPQAWLADVLHRINSPSLAPPCTAALELESLDCHTGGAGSDPERRAAFRADSQSAMIPFFWPRCRSCSLSATASRLGGIRTRR
jgi:IS66 C-terminal element